MSSTRFQILIVLAVAVAAASYLVYRVKSHPTAANAEVTDSLPGTNSQPAPETSSAPAAPSATNTGTDDQTTDDRRLRDLAPTKEDVRADVAKDPHLPPATLMKFASQLGHRLEIAEKSEEQSAAITSELDECMRNENHPETIRALCLASAKRLADRYPSLKSRADEMFHAAGPRISSLAK